MPGYRSLCHSLTLAALLALMGAPVYPAASPAAPAPEFAAWTHRAWTARDKAPRFVQALAQDRDGFLWLGSYEGLFRFDGDSFEAIPPVPGHPRNAQAVSALAAAPDGSLWVGYAGNGGLAVYRGGRLREIPGGPGQGEVTRIVIGADGQPWIALGGAPHSLYRYYGGRWVAVVDKVLDEHEAEPQMLARNGTLWFGTWSGPIHYLPRGATMPLLSPMPSPMMMRGGGALGEARDGAIWSMDASGLRLVPAYDRGAVGMPPAPRVLGKALPPADFFRAVMDGYGRFWATTFRSGVVMADPATGLVAHYGERDGLSSDRASPILADRDGQIWIGTERGLDRFSPSPLAQVAALSGPMRGGYMAAEAGGIVYLAAEQNVWRAAPGQAPQWLAHTASWIGGLCASPQGDLWTLQKDRLVTVAGPQAGRAMAMPGSALDLGNCAVAGDGSLWLAVPALGLFHREGGAWRKIALPQAWGAPDSITLDPQGRLYAILGRRNILRYDHGKMILWQGARIGFERPTALILSGQDVLVGGMTGLLRISAAGLSKLDVGDHPWLQDVRGMAVTPDGSSWLLTYHGIMRVSRAALERAFAAPASPLAHAQFDEDDRRIAVPQRDSGPQAVVDGAGRGFFLTRSGVLETSGLMAEQQAPFRLFIRQVLADGRAVAAQSGLALPYDVAAVTIAYGALDLATPGQRRFRVRLAGSGELWPDGEGASGGWVDNGALRQITYAHLSPGAYRFEVETQDALGRWQAGGAALDFTIRPAFWQTGWFRGGLLAAAGLLLWLAYRWRMALAVERVRAAKEAQVSERERIARELHDTLLQGVQGMMLRFQAVAHRQIADEAGREELESVLERGDDVLVQARERVMDLRMASGSVDLVARLQAELDRHDSPLLHLAVTGRPRAVCAPVVEELACVVAEALTNALRHAQAGRIEVKIVFGWRRITVLVADDGVGMGDLGGKPGHFGLQGMRERTRKFGATFTITSRAGQGTSILLRLPARIAYSGAV